ncbi:MAG TPA: ferredoxin [Clostridiales bacterium]|nr:ferredoxin [Clostridiales bacterium]
MKSKVFFSSEITPEKVVELFHAAANDLPGGILPGKVAVKLHSGEPGNQNFLKPEFWQPIVNEVHGTVVECNTAYDGGRNTTEKHRETMEKHGWNKHFTVDIMDAEGPDAELSIPNGKRIKKVQVGKNMLNYDSMLVLSHFKGHPMGGFGGALKQLSIGCASSYGKAYIHGAGEPEKIWTADHDAFLESMADAAEAVVRHFNGNMIFVNVMKNMSVDCDCCSVAEDPCMADTGILASLDPIAVDRACLDLVYASDDPGRDHLLERIESRNGAHTVDAAAELGFGSKEYELVKL